MLNLILILDSTSSDKITMMQIETIIINTSFIQITEKSIPEDFLKSSNNSTTSCHGPLEDPEVKTHFNDTRSPPEDFQPLPKAAKFPTYFNTLDMLKEKSNARK